jgi:hypothetical protein
LLQRADVIGIGVRQQNFRDARLANHFGDFLELVARVNQRGFFRVGTHEQVTILLPLTDGDLFDL